MTPILYLSYTGMMEPLGRSQVLNYLGRLGDTYNFTLISFEKPEHLADKTAIAALESEIEAMGITWIPLTYHKRPRLLASAWDMARFARRARSCVKRENIALIHARGYIASFVALSVARTTKRPFIFDMRAFWPEELIAAGRLKRGSLTHRVIRRLERACLDQAAGIVSLTQAAVDHMEKTIGPRHYKVIPTCADLGRFTETTSYPSPPVIGCLGTVTSGWFKLDWLAGFFQAVARQIPEARFEVLTRNDPDTVRKALLGGALTTERIAVRAVAHDDVPAALNGQSASAMFFTSGIAKMASCPTRMGEILGTGRPVIANEGVGDVAAMIRAFNVGVVIEANNPEAMDSSAKDMVTLLSDPELPARCRQAAEEYFSLEAGADRYRQVYQTILN